MKSLLWRLWPAFFACWLLLLSTSVIADDTLSMADALVRTLKQSPQLESYSYALRATEAERLQAGLLPNPSLRLELENFTGSGQLRGARSLETTLMLSQLLELGDKRRRREQTVAMRMGLVEADYAIVRLDVLAEVARRFIHVARDQALLEVARSAVELAQDNRSAVEKRVNAARAMESELSRAEIELARVRLILEHREHELLSAKRRLAAGWGSDQVGFSQVSADLFALPKTRSLDALLKELRSSPHMQRFLSEHRLRAAELELAQARAVPDARVGAGLKRNESVDDQALMLNFSIDLPVFDRNQGNIRAAQERLDQVTTAESARYIEAQSLLFTTYQELSHARTEANMLHETIIPQAQKTLESYESGYQSGRFSYLEMAAARREFIEIRSEAIRAAASYHIYLIEIERLAGLGFGVSGAGLP